MSEVGVKAKSSLAPRCRLSYLGVGVEDVKGDYPPVWSVGSRLYGTRFRGCRVHGTRFKIAGVCMRVSGSGMSVSGVD